MRIRYNATGVIDEVPNELGRSLINSGQATAVLDRSIKRTYSPTAVTWEIVTHPFVGVRFFAGEVGCTDGTRRKQYSCTYMGHPDNVNEKKVWEGGGRFVVFGREVPEEIVKQYREMWKANKNLRAPQQGLGPAFVVSQERLQMENADRENLINRIRAADEFARTVKNTDGWPTD